MGERASVIYVVDDEVACRTALGRCLRSAGYQPRSYASGEEVIGDASADVIPACMILDLLMPAGMSGLELLERLSAAGRRCPTIILTACNIPEKAFLAAKLGACDFVRKPVSDTELLRKIRKLIAASRSRELPRGARRRKAQESLRRLSPRERQVLSLLENRGRKQVAAEMGVGYSTVKYYCDNIFRKLGVHSARAALEIWNAAVSRDR